MTKTKYFIILTIALCALGMIITAYMIDWRASLCFAGGYGLSRFAIHLMQLPDIDKD